MFNIIMVWALLTPPKKFPLILKEARSCDLNKGKLLLEGYFCQDEDITKRISFASVFASLHVAFSLSVTEVSRYH